MKTGDRYKKTLLINQLKTESGTGAIFAIMNRMVQQSENIALYEQQMEKGTLDPFPYDRLMIHYRKQKEYKKELQIINQAIKTFSDQLKKQASQLFEGAKSQSAVKRLSEKFSKLSGLTDKKGNPKYLPEPLARWTKRKQTVQEKIKKVKI